MLNCGDNSDHVCQNGGLSKLLGKSCKFLQKSSPVPPVRMLPNLGHSIRPGPRQAPGPVVLFLRSWYSVIFFISVFRPKSLGTDTSISNAFFSFLYLSTLSRHNECSVFYVHARWDHSVKHVHYFLLPNYHIWFMSFLELGYWDFCRSASLVVPLGVRGV